MKILGIDPGTQVAGFGVIEKSGSKILTLEYGSVKAEKKTNLCPATPYHSCQNHGCHIKTST